MSENDLKKAIIKYLIYQGYLILRVNSGAREEEYNGKRRFFWFSKWWVLSKTEKRSGVSDIIAIKNGATPLAIETKLPGNKPTEAQQEFLGEWEEHGGIGIVAYSLDDLIEVLER